MKGRRGIWQCVVDTHFLTSSVQDAESELTLSKKDRVSRAICVHEEADKERLPVLLC